MKKVLITGANGLLGQKLIALLENHPDLLLTATGRGACRLPASPHYAYLSLDISNEDALSQAIEKLRPDCIIHTAAMTNVDECEQNHADCRIQNVDVVAHLARLAAQFDIFLLHLSTDFIFDGLAGPYTEQAEASPLSFYGECKAEAEQLVMQTAGRWAIVRTVLVYGVALDMSRSNIVLWVKKSLQEGKTIKVVDDQWRTPTLAEDLAQGCKLIMLQEKEGIFNISGQQLMTPYDMAQRVAAYFGLDASLIVRADSSTFVQPAARPPRTGFIIEKAKTELGYRPHSFTEGLAIIQSQLDVLNVV